MIDLPTLYKKTATGAIQSWQIQVKENVIITRFGQVGGAIQTTEDTIWEGKSAGRSNETTANQQAELEAEAKHLRQLKKGYVDAIEKAELGQTDDVIEGGFLPMLAKDFSEHEKKIEYPACIQPKFDGHRCIAVLDELGRATLWSRTRKRITSMPHIIAVLESTGAKSIVMDGELYNHDMKAEFEKLTSMIRQEEPQPGCEIVQYHCYDVIMDGTFKERNAFIEGITQNLFPTVQAVSTLIVNSKEEVIKFHDVLVGNGYEGLMIRNISSPYEQKRSVHLQKVKIFKDAEFLILRLEEGRGKLQGHAGTCICAMEDGQEFRCKMSGSTSELKKAWENPELWIGRLLTVQYQGLTSSGRPRFPVGLRIREDV